MNWYGLGGWNYYFLLKFVLLKYGYLNFHPFINLVFLALLLFPVPSLSIHRVRNYCLAPIGLVLFYHDTWLPGFATIFSQGSNLASFNMSYLIELTQRFTNWTLIGIAFVLLIGYLYISQWIRVTVFTISGLIWLNIAQTSSPISVSTPQIANKPSQTTLATAITPPYTKQIPPTDTNTLLNDYLNQFYAAQEKLVTSFVSKLPDNAEPFDILLLQVCSLSWADINSVNLQKHPLWGKFDIMFKHFNSVASYSGPAALRLLRASCGQESHDNLYKNASPACYLFHNLSTLGFSPELMLDHDGAFEDFLKIVRELGDMQDVPMVSRDNITPDMTSFTEALLSDDGQLLDRWLNQRIAQGTNQRSATYFNIVSLHDGNAFIGSNKPAPYLPRGQKLLDEIDAFFTKLEKTGRKTMVVFIPEHGANLTGDKLQISGLRDIPSPNITQIPVGIKFFGMKSNTARQQILVNEPSSYLALSEIIARVVDGTLFNQENAQVDLLTKKLPKTDPVSTNEGATVMEYQNKPYILLKGDSNWVPYPQE